MIDGVREGGAFDELRDPAPASGANDPGADPRSRHSWYRLRLAGAHGLEEACQDLGIPTGPEGDPAEQVGQLLAGLYYHTCHLAGSPRLWAESIAVMTRILAEKGP